MTIEFASLSDGGMNSWEYYSLKPKVRYIDQNEMFLKPSDIFYSQDTIACKFQNGNLIDNAVKLLLMRRLSAEDFPTIHVIRRSDRKYYSLDNRRLYVFRVGQCLGIVAKVPVQVVMEQPHHKRKFTSRNGGTKIIVRQGATRVNWMDSWIKIAQPQEQVMMLQRPFTAQSLNREVRQHELPARRTTHIGVPTKYRTLSSHDEAGLSSAFKRLGLCQPNKFYQSQIMPSRRSSHDRHVAVGSLNVDSKDTPRSNSTGSRPLTEKQKLRAIRLRMFLSDPIHQ